MIMRIPTKTRKRPSNIRPPSIVADAIAQMEAPGKPKMAVRATTISPSSSDMIPGLLMAIFRSL
jgi:hypothetical protein